MHTDHNNKLFTNDERYKVGNPNQKDRSNQIIDKKKISVLCGSSKGDILCEEEVRDGVYDGG